MADLDGDGIDDAFDSTGRTMMMVAMQMGEKFSRLYEEMSRNAAARDDSASREMGARFEAERGAARSALQVIDQPSWWERATPQDVARVIETAETWKGLDDTALKASERIEREVRDRYGVDVSEFRPTATTERASSDREVTEAALLIAEADRLDRAADHRGRGAGVEDGDGRSGDLAKDLEDRATEYERLADSGGDGANSPEELRELATDARSQAQLYRDMDDATQSTRTQEAPTPEAQASRAEAGVVYDSAERRRNAAQQMEAAGVPEADVRVRARVDVGQSQPAAEAVSAGARAGTRRPGHGPQTPTPQRTDRGR